jgi:hypothetical protein
MPCAMIDCAPEKRGSSTASDSKMLVRSLMHWFTMVDESTISDCLESGSRRLTVCGSSTPVSGSTSRMTPLSAGSSEKGHVQRARQQHREVQRQAQAGQLVGGAQLVVVAPQHLDVRDLLAGAEVRLLRVVQRGVDVGGVGGGAGRQDGDLVAHGVARAVVDAPAEHQVHRAEEEIVALAEHHLTHAALVDEGAVGGVQIAQQEVAVGLALDDRVLLGDLTIVQADGVLGVAADRVELLEDELVLEVLDGDVHQPRARPALVAGAQLGHDDLGRYGRLTAAAHRRPGVLGHRGGAGVGRGGTAARAGRDRRRGRQRGRRRLALAR